MKIDIDPEDSSVSILVIEDGENSREVTIEMVRLSFPLAHIHDPRNFFIEDIEKTIIESAYTLIIVDYSLARWEPHPKFGVWGENIVSFTKKHSRDSYILGITDDEEENQTMIAKGASRSVIKRHFLYEKLKPDLTLAMRSVTTAP